MQSLYGVAERSSITCSDSSPNHNANKVSHLCTNPITHHFRPDSVTQPYSNPHPFAQTHQIAISVTNNNSISISLLATIVFPNVSAFNKTNDLAAHGVTNEYPNTVADEVKATHFVSDEPTIDSPNECPTFYIPVCPERILQH